MTTYRENMKRVPMDECIKGRVYKINCRNLKLGVYDGNEGFIGIRTKFGSRYLATEYHWDQGPPFGTVSGVEDTGLDLPDTIAIMEYLGTENETNGRRIFTKKDVLNPNWPAEKGYMGWWHYEDTGEICETVKEGCRAVAIPNDDLFEFLDQKEKELCGDES